MSWLQRYSHDRSRGSEKKLPLPNEEDILRRHLKVDHGFSDDSFDRWLVGRDHLQLRHWSSHFDWHILPTRLVESDSVPRGTTHTHGSRSDFTGKSEIWENRAEVPDLLRGLKEKGIFKKFLIPLIDSSHSPWISKEQEAKSKYDPNGKLSNWEIKRLAAGSFLKHISNNIEGYKKLSDELDEAKDWVNGFRRGFLSYDPEYKKFKPKDYLSARDVVSHADIMDFLKSSPSFNVAHYNTLREEQFPGGRLSHDQIMEAVGHGMQTGTYIRKLRNNVGKDPVARANRKAFNTALENTRQVEIDRGMPDWQAKYNCREPFQVHAIAAGYDPTKPRGITHDELMKPYREASHE